MCLILAVRQKYTFGLNLKCCHLLFDSSTFPYACHIAKWWSTSPTLSCTFSKQTNCTLKSKIIQLMWWCTGILKFLALYISKFCCLFICYKTFTPYLLLLSVHHRVLLDPVLFCSLHFPQGRMVLISYSFLCPTFSLVFVGRRIMDGKSHI